MSSPLDSLREGIRTGRERFMALQVRERWMLGVCVVFLVFIVLWLGIYDPIVKAHKRRADALETSRALAIRLEEAAAKVQGQRSGPVANRGISLIAAVDQASRSGTVGKAPSKIQPEGDAEVRVWFEDVSFDPMVRWVADLQTRYGITVQTMTVEPKSEAGSVDIQLSLVRR